MKKICLSLILLAMICAVVLAALPATPFDPGSGQHLTTVQRMAKEVEVAEANMAALDANDGMSWAACQTLCTPIPPQWNAVSLSFYGWGDGGDTQGVADVNDPGDPNDATFTFSVYVCDLYGGLEPVIVGASGTVGYQQLSINPATGAELNSGDPNTSYCWADTISGGTATWSKTIIYSNYGGTNTRAKLKFDRQESYGIYVRIYGISSDVATVTAVMNGY